MTRTAVLELRRMARAFIREAREYQATSTTAHVYQEAAELCRERAREIAKWEKGRRE